MKPQDISEKFDTLVKEQIELGEQHANDQYFTDMTTGRNVGQDELAAAKLARTAKGDYLSADDPQSYATGLLIRLMEPKKSYERVYEDFDGFGAGTFWALFRSLSEYFAASGIVPDYNPFQEDEQDDENGGLSEAFPGDSGENGIDFYEFERQLEDSIISLQFSLKRGEYLIAFDFAQIHLLQLATRLYLSLPSISSAETLLFCHRIRRIQSVLVEVIYRASIPRMLSVVVYRYIAAAGSLLTFVERTRKGQLTLAPRSSGAKLPCSLLGLDRERAMRHINKPHGPIAEYDDDMPHAMGYRLLTDLNELVDEPCANFLNRMFEDVGSILAGMPEACNIVHYVVADSFQEDDWTVTPNSAKLHCFILEQKMGDPYLTIMKIGPYAKVAEVVVRLGQAASHAVIFNGDRSGGDLESDRDWLSMCLLDTLTAKFLHGSPRLAIIAEGIMAAVPYAGLETSSGRLLVEDFDLIFSSSFRSLSKRWRIAFQDVANGAIVGSPAYGVDTNIEGSSISSAPKRRFRPLPHALSECEAVAKNTKWSFVVEREATVGAVKELLPTVQALHLVTHGVYDRPVEETSLTDALKEPDEFFAFEQRVMNGAKVALAGANTSSDESSSLICTEDLEKLDIKQLQFVFLSLCVGSAGATVTGESLFGLARSFLASGTTTVIASLFPVDDVIGEKIAGYFYGQFAGDREAVVERCLKEAQMLLVRQGVPWYMWAGHQVLI